LLLLAEETEKLFPPRRALRFHRKVSSALLAHKQQARGAKEEANEKTFPPHREPKSLHWRKFLIKTQFRAFSLPSSLKSRACGWEIMTTMSLN
jgi:hypothetical protein